MSATTKTTTKLALLALMVLQNSSVVLLGRYTRGPTIPKDDLYVVNHLIIITEFIKLVASLIIEGFTTNGKLIKSINDNIISNPKDALKISIPALLYLIQNNVLYLALSNLSAPFFQVTYQCKLVTTAIVSVLMLNRKYALKQWICLVVISIGVAIVVLAESSSSSSSSSGSMIISNDDIDNSGGGGSSNSTTDGRFLFEITKEGEMVEEGYHDKLEKKQAAAAVPEQSLVVGLVAVSIASLSSAFASVYFEKVVKGKESGSKERAPVSLWMRNVQLAFFSVVIAIGQYYTDKTEENANKEFMHGFTTWVWCVVLLQAGGGLLIAAVIKYADNVLKGLATAVSVILSTVLSMIFFNTSLTVQFTFGAMLILSSVYLFTNNIPPIILLLMPCCRSCNTNISKQDKDGASSSLTNNNADVIVDDDTPSEQTEMKSLVEKSCCSNV